VPKHMLLKLVRRKEEDRGEKAPVLLRGPRTGLLLLLRRLGSTSRGYALAGAGVVVGAVVVVSLLSWLAPDSDRPVGHPLEVVERVAGGVLEQVDGQVAALLGTEGGPCYGACARVWRQRAPQPPGRAILPRSRPARIAARLRPTTLHFPRPTTQRHLRPESPPLPRMRHHRSRRPRRRPALARHLPVRTRHRPPLPASRRHRRQRSRPWRKSRLLHLPQKSPP
jgi:hypothetical protein